MPEPPAVADRGYYYEAIPSGAKALTLTPGVDYDFVTELVPYNRPRYPTSDTRALQDVSWRNELVLACLGAKAVTAQDPRLIVQRARRDGGSVIYDAVPDHPFRHLFMRPNPEMTEADLMRAAIVSWDISNPRRFYCEKVYERGALVALYPLNPAAMQPLYSRTTPDARIGYRYSDGSIRRDYSDEELLIRSAPAWYDPPPLVAAMGSVESDAAQTDYVRAFFENGGVPSGFLKYTDAHLSTAQREDIRQKWRAIYGGRNRHDIGVLDAGVDYQEIGARLDSLQSDVLRQVTESRICMVFRVPPLIIYAYTGLLRATYSNLGEAWAGFWDSTMSPLFKEWRDFFTWHVLTEFEETRAITSGAVRLHYDLSDVAALQEDVDAAQTRARANFQAGLMTLNETRAIAGLPPDPAGDYYLRELATQAVPQGVAPDAALPATALQPAKRAAEPPEAKAYTAADVIERRMRRQIESAAAQTWAALITQVQQEGNARNARKALPAPAPLLPVVYRGRSFDPFVARDDDDTEEEDMARMPQFAAGSRVQVVGPPHMPDQATGLVAIAVCTPVYGILFDGMEDMGVHRWYVEAELVPADTPPPTEPTPLGTPRFARGSRVQTIIAPPHMPGQTTGAVVIAAVAPVYGIIFDGMEQMGVHKWYVEAELMPADATAADGTTPAMAM